MARYHGKVGYVLDSVETSPGVWEEQITERSYYGDVIKNKTNIQQNTVVNAGVTISNSISIVGDMFALENVMSIRYITYLNKKWKISNVEIESPRLILSLGGLYNE